MKNNKYIFIIIFLLVICILITLFSQPIVYQQAVLNSNEPILKTRPNYGYTNTPNDILLNPYSPPLKDTRYINDGQYGGIPINVSTNAVNTNYRQVGIITTLHGKTKVFPLMGRPLYTNRDKWQYYTIDSNNIKLPIRYKGRSGSNEYGIDSLCTFERIFVEGYEEEFKVTLYENQTLNYLPFL